MAGKSHGLRLQDSGPCSERSPLRAAWPTWLCRAPLSSGPGMWRWSLHKKVERDPGKSPALVRILLRELEKVGSRASRGQQELEEERPIHCGLSPSALRPPNCGYLWAICITLTTCVSLLYFSISNIFLTLTPIV